MERSLILLSLGTHQQPFARALDLVKPIAEQGSELLIQHGSTPAREEMPNASWVKYMPYADVVEIMARVDSVICHAGVGTIMTALKAGHRPVVIPREARFGEHVDDHQLDIATRFAERGLVHRVSDETDLRPLLAQRIEDPSGVIGKGSSRLRTAVAQATEAQARRRWLLPSR